MREALVASLALVACGHSHGTSDGGGDGNGSSDAMMFDAAIDAPNVRGTVFVHVINPADLTGTSNGLVCEAGQHVIFIDTDATQTDVTTDGSGDAQGSVFPGASVNIICHRLSTSAPPAIDYLVATIQSIEPGDHLVLDEGAMITGRQIADATTVGTFHVSYSSYSGAAAYTVYGPCGGVSSASTSVTLAMQAGCMLATMDIVAVALDGTGNPIGYADQPNVAFTSGGSTTIAGSAWHALASVGETVSNLPAFCSNAADPNYPCTVQANRYVPGLHGLPANGMAAPTATIATALAQNATMQTIVLTSGTPDQTITEAVDGTQTSHALDFGASELPWLCTTQSASCAAGAAGCCVSPGAPAFDAANARITLNVTGTQAIDIFEADAMYVRANTTIFIWRVFGPTPGDVQLPTLPTADGDVTPKPNDRQAATHAMVGESDAIAGWRPARLDVMSSLNTCTQPMNATAPRYGGTRNRLSRSN